MVTSCELGFSREVVDRSVFENSLLRHNKNDQRKALSVQNLNSFESPRFRTSLTG